MKMIALSVVALALAFAVSLASKLSAEPKTPIPNRLIDYAAFQQIVNESQGEHENHRLSENAFLAAMAQPDVIVLDARSAGMFQRQHIRGAVNLPFTDFTAQSLAGILPRKDTKILIYCNNNFLRSPIAFASKTASASLNLSTYTSLKSYGYDNVFELGPLLDAEKTKIPFQGSAINASR